MQLHRHFADAEIERDLLVDPSARDFVQNLALAKRKLLKSLDAAPDCARRRDTPDRD